MSRSKHNGCGATCGICKPHKKWKSNSSKGQKPSVRRKEADVRRDIVDYANDNPRTRGL